MVWWNSSWNKKKKITLTGGSSGAQSAYQMKFDVVYDSDMKSDFSDLRFTNGAEDSLIDAWLESKVDSTSAVVWVETDTPANGVDADIYMYYGNSGATSNWTIANTFLTGDDFDDDDTAVAYKIFATDSLPHDDGLPQAFGAPQNPSAVYVSSQDKTYIVYGSSDTHPKILYYDHATNAFSSITDIGGTGIDDHGPPIISVDSSGYFYVFYHYYPLYYKKSTNAYDITAWGSEINVAANGVYESSFFYGSTLYLLFLNKYGALSDRQFVFTKTTDGGANWDSITKLTNINTPDTPYGKYIMDSDGTIHLTWSILDATDSIRKDLYYMKSEDGGTTWKKADGTTLTIPVTESTAEKVYNSGTDFCNSVMGGVQIDSTGKPIILFSSNHVYRLARWGGSSWTINTVVSVDHNFDVGALVLDSDSQFRAYVSVGTGKGGELKEYISTDSGVNWGYVKTISEGTVTHVKQVYTPKTDDNLELVFCGGDGGIGAVAAWGKDCTYTSVPGWTNNWINIGDGALTQTSTTAKFGTYSGKIDMSASNGGAYRMIDTIDNDAKSIIIYIRKPTNTLYMNTVFGDGFGGSTVDYADAAVQLQFATDGNIKYHNGTAMQTLQTYSADTWYKVELIDFDFTNYTCDIYIDDVLRQNDAAFRNSKLQITDISITAGTDSGQMQYIDGFVVRKYAANPATYAFGSEESESSTIPIFIHHYNMQRRLT